MSLRPMNITPDQLTAAGSYIARYWGDDGYRIESIASPTSLVSVFHVVARDGSRFIVLTDRWGNSKATEPQGNTNERRAAHLAPIVAEMTRHAGAA